MFPIPFCSSRKLTGAECYLSHRQYKAGLLRFCFPPRDLLLRGKKMAPVQRRPGPFLRPCAAVSRSPRGMNRHHNAASCFFGGITVSPTYR